MNSLPSSRELDLKLDRIRSLLAEHQLDALLISRVKNFAWATCGADSHIDLADSLGIASLLITQSSRYVVTNNIEADRLMVEEGLEDQGWEIQSAPWHEGDALLQKLTREMSLGADFYFPQAVRLDAELTKLRSSLTPQEGERFRQLGNLCAESMQDAVDAVHPGLSEFQIAALLAGALERRGVQIVVNLVAADERIFSYRHPLPTAKQLRNYVMMVLCGRKWGLICSMTRILHFGKLPDEIRSKGHA
ncbi:MAG: aminopeptidase P family protein, partial [Anaerolineales bacterium]